MGRLRLGLAPGAWPLEPVERRMGFPRIARLTIIMADGVPTALGKAPTEFGVLTAIGEAPTRVGIVPAKAHKP